MDKKKCGLFLKQLREERNLTQSKMVEEFSANVGVYGDAISETSISKWERGESFPDIVNLKDIARFFNVTLDELCNGERAVFENFEDRYFICKKNWAYEYYSKDKNCNLWQLNNEQAIKIEKRFNDLLGKLVDDTITTTQEKEFDFLCANFYNTTEKLSVEDAKFKIRKESALMHKASFSEKMWEAYKLFDYKLKLDFFKDICDNVEGEPSAIIAKRIKETKEFEKDILLALIQKNNVTYINKDNFNKTFGVEYNEEALTKKAIRLLIENGAKLNKNLMGYYETVKRKHKTINDLVYMHRIYKKPILVKEYTNKINQRDLYKAPSCNYYLIKNTFFNRQLLRNDYPYNENDIFCDENLYNELENKLYNGELEFVNEETYWSGIDDYSSEEWSLSWREALKDELESLRSDIKKQSFKGYYNQRNDKETKELLKDLDILTLTQIREKYFTVELKKDEELY